MPVDGITLPAQARKGDLDIRAIWIFRLVPRGLGVLAQCKSSFCPDWRNGRQASAVEAVPFPLTSAKWSAAPLAESTFLFVAPTVGVASTFLKGPVDPVWYTML